MRAWQQEARIENTRPIQEKMSRLAFFGPLFEVPDPPECEHDATPAERAEAFHRATPSVYAALVSECRRFRKSGNDRWSIKGAFERLRWMASRVGYYDEFKLNNSYTAFYARLIMEQEEDLRGIFELRESK